MIKRFLNDSLLYVVAGVFTKGIAFFMLPFYVAYLSKEEYGIFDYILTIGSFLGVCIALEISQSVIRFSSEHNDDKEKQFKYISNGLWFTLIAYSIFILISSLFLEYISFFLTGDKGNGSIVILALFSYLATALMYFITVAYRSMLNAKAATISSAISAALVASFSLLFIHLFELRVEALLISLILGQSLVAISNIYMMRSMLIFKIDFEILKTMLAFSFPLILSSLGVIMSLLVDRIMIKEMLTFEDLAIYGVAARFASLGGLLVMGFQSALAPLIYNSLENTNLNSNLKKMFFGYTVIAFFIVLLLYYISDELIEIVVGKSYIQSSEIMTLLALSVLIQSAAMFFPGLSIVKKTHILAFINIFTGLFNILLNYIMLPKYGVMGAAYSTLITSSLYFILNSYFSEQNYPLIFNSNNNCNT